MLAGKFADVEFALDAAGTAGERFVLAGAEPGRTRGDCFVVGDLARIGVRFGVGVFFATTALDTTGVLTCAGASVISATGGTACGFTGVCIILLPF